MRKQIITLTAILMLGVVPALMAQQNTPQNSGRGNNDQRANWLVKELNLTSQQMDKLNTMREGFRQEMQTMLQDPDLTREQKQEKAQEMRVAHRESMKTVLTEDQIEKLEALRKDRPLGPGMGLGDPDGSRRGRGFDPERHQALLAERQVFDNQLTQAEKETISAMREKIRQNRGDCPGYGQGNVQGQCTGMGPRQGQGQCQGQGQGQGQGNGKVNGKGNGIGKGNGKGHGCGQGSETGRHQGYGRAGAGNGFGPGGLSQQDLDALNEIAAAHDKQLDKIMESFPPKGPATGAGTGKNAENGRMPADRGQRFKTRFLLMDADMQIGTSSSTNSSLRLFPNPAGDKVTVSFTKESTGPVRIEMMDKAGQSVFLKEWAGITTGEQSVTLDLSAIPAGEVYLLKMTSDGKTPVKKLIRE